MRKSNNKETITNKILGIFISSPQKKFNYKQLSSLLNINDASGRKKVIKVLEDLVKAGSITEEDPGRFQLKSKVGFVKGIVDISKAGHAYIISEDISEDVFVSLKNLNTALHGDEVEVAVYSKKRSDRIHGEVVKIIRRNKTEFVGTIDIVNKNLAFVIPDSNRMLYDIFVPHENLNGARNKQKVIAEITEWHDRTKNPTGKIVKILGTPGDNEVEMHSILAEFGLPAEFDKAVEKEAQKISDEIREHDLKNRKDFRQTLTFTIDPEDAKDFDDAISFKELENNLFEIGVHIADVTHYLHENSLIDKDAVERATSVYLVDRVVPMLPERLSNFVCSLRPNEDKLCFSVVFKIDKDAKVHDVWFGKTVINSNKRFDYNQVQEIIDTNAGEFSREITIINDITQILRKERLASGSFNFDQNEIKFILNDKLEPIGVYFKEYKEAGQLIEELMLLANKKVAEFIGEKIKKEFVYRIHDKPNPEKLSSFTDFISQFGYSINTKNNITLSTSMNKLISEIHGNPEQNIIENLAIRAMSKAVYSTKNIGHYGLAFKYYTHFTSPIRRYPDVMVHRLLDNYLHQKEYKISEAESICKHCSNKEQQAVMAERASIKFKQAEYLSDKIGEVFEGIISGVTEYGLFVEIKENKCEGLVHIRTLNDDYYEYQQENHRIEGRNFGIIYQLGDEVKIRIINVNLPKKEVDFELV